MRFIAITSSIVAVILAAIWAIKIPGWDSMVALAAAIAALASSFFLKKSHAFPTQSQKVSGSSIGIQAGRDVTNKDIK
jgi:hypothetical protein